MEETVKSSQSHHDDADDDLLSLCRFSRLSMVTENGSVLYSVYDSCEYLAISATCGAQWRFSNWDYLWSHNSDEMDPFRSLVHFMCRQQLVDLLDASLIIGIAMSSLLPRSNGT